jgi:hypothetical protein
MRRGLEFVKLGSFMRAKLFLLGATFNSAGCAGLVFTIAHHGGGEKPQNHPALVGT